MRTTFGLALLLAASSAACGGAEDEATVPEHSADPYLEAWRKCLQPSVLEGVEFETIPNLELEIEGVRVVTGSLGQRGPDVDASGKVLRIAAVGGELTFGMGLVAEEAWPQALARQLNHTILSAGKRVEALNLGTAFASVTDVLELARQRALGWEPWLMVVELDSTCRGGATVEELRARLTALRSASAQAHCGVLVLVSLPIGEPLDDSYAWIETHRLLLDEAQRAGFSTLDLREVLAGQGIETLVAGATEHFRGHATAHAQTLVLEAVKRRFYDSGLLTAALESK